MPDGYLTLQVDDDIVRIEAGALAHLVSHLIFHPSATFRRHGVVRSTPCDDASPPIHPMQTNGSFFSL
jgi:hypothetical protein